MAHFVLQTFNGIIEHDFVFHLKKSLEYHQWMYPLGAHTFEFSDVPLSQPGSFPVGDLEFVFNSLSCTGELNPSKRRPLNVPESLNDFYFTKRKIHRSSDPTNPFTEKSFVKSDSAYKSFNDLIDIDKKTDFIDSSYFFSEEIPIESEWRVFVYNNSVVGIGHYSGYALMMPDVNFIDNTVSNFKDAPQAYTLDIAVSGAQNALLEVHPFVSCGLYGFADLKALPGMFMEGIRFLKT